MLQQIEDNLASMQPWIYIAGIVIAIPATVLFALQYKGGTKSPMHAAYAVAIGVLLIVLQPILMPLAIMITDTIRQS